MSEAKVVWCVVCITPGETGADVTHIFSSLAAAEEFSRADSRAHVIYDYVLDFPERFEGRVQ